MKPDFRITQGNRPLIKDTLTDSTGTPVDLTGCQVQWIFQCGGTTFTRTAALTNSPGTDGAVQYQTVADDTASPGLYQAQWAVTLPSGIVRTFPTGSLDNDDASGRYICFEIVPALPLAASPTNIVLLQQMYEPVRVTLGDFNATFQKFSDSAIASVLRTCLVMGKVPGHTLSSDRLSITPGLTIPRDMALLMNHAAKTFLAPRVAEFRIGTRALEQRVGRQEHFWFDLNNAIYELENGEMFSSFQSFYAWVNALTGIDIWSVMSDMKTAAPVATVNIGRAGVTVSTT